MNEIAEQVIRESEIKIKALEYYKNISNGMVEKLKNETCEYDGRFFEGVIIAHRFMAEIMGDEIETLRTFNNKIRSEYDGTKN